MASVSPFSSAPSPGKSRVGFTFSFEIDGEKELEATLFRYQASLEDFEPAFEKIADDFLEVEKRQFETQGSRGEEGKWEPMSPNTKCGKQDRHPEHEDDLLIAEGDLVNSLTDKSNPSHIREVSEDSLKLGTKEMTAVWQHFGTDGPYEIEGNPYLIFSLCGDLVVTETVTHPGLPARPVIDLNNQDKERWIRILQTHVFRPEGTGTVPTGNVQETPFALDDDFEVTRFEV